MENSGFSNFALGCCISRVADSSTHFSGTYSDRTNCINKRWNTRVEDNSISIVHRQQLVSQATAAACSVDSTSHESFTETFSDRGMLCASKYRNNANSAQHCDFSLRESHINECHTSENEVGIKQTAPGRCQTSNINSIKYVKIKEKRRRLRQ